MIQKARKAVHDPARTLAYVRRGEQGLRDVEASRALARVLLCTPARVGRCMQELRRERFASLLAQRKGPEYRGEVGHGPILYALCRILRPETVVETGVASGVSSAYMLKAMHVNGFGKLYSVDMPNYEEVLHREFPEVYHASVAIVPPGREVGWVVPEDLRRPWVLRIGKVADVLPDLLADLGSIDVFLHDSEHTYANMRWEYALTWNRIREGGVLATDDAMCNGAFSEFAEHTSAMPEVIDDRLGLIRKRPADVFEERNRKRSA